MENEDVKIEDFYNVWSCMDTLKLSNCITVMYLLAILKILPDFMKHRKPINLKRILIMYNTLQVFLSAYNVYLFAVHAMHYGVASKKCWADFNRKQLDSILKPIFCYLVSKHLDLLDTVFFVLRKKKSQLTFLHIYHHTVTLNWSWLNCMYFPTDYYLFVGMTNCFVHVILYTYYALSSMGPQYSKYIWWKKYLTMLQMIQFVAIIFYLFYKNKTTLCPPISSTLHWYGILSFSLFFVLFLKFYIERYAIKLNLINMQKGK